MFHYFPSSGDFFHLLITFANSLETNQSPNLDPNCPEKYFEEVKLEKNIGRQQQSMKITMHV